MEKWAMGKSAGFGHPFAPRSHDEGTPVSFGSYQFSPAFAISQSCRAIGFDKNRPNQQSQKQKEKHHAD
jgi:hypothetical protein